MRGSCPLGGAACWAETVTIKARHRVISVAVQDGELQVYTHLDVAYKARSALAERAKEDLPAATLQ